MIFCQRLSRNVRKSVIETFLKTDGEVLAMPRISRVGRRAWFVMRDRQSRNLKGTKIAMAHSSAGRFTTVFVTHDRGPLYLRPGCARM